MQCPAFETATRPILAVVLPGTSSLPGVLWNCGSKSSTLRYSLLDINVTPYWGAPQPAVRSRRDWPFLIDLASQLASLIRCGQDCPFSVKVSDPDWTCRHPGAFSPSPPCE